MKCPKCNQSPLSFKEFTIRFNLEHLICRNCGAKLKRDQQSRLISLMVLIITLSLSVFIAIGAVYLNEVREWASWSSLLLAIAIVIGMGILVEIWLYRIIKYVDLDDIE